MNNYYDVRLKQNRLDTLLKYKNFTFIEGDIANKQQVEKIFLTHRPKIVVNLAAQAGVRYSITSKTRGINFKYIICKSSKDSIII